MDLNRLWQQLGTAFTGLLLLGVLVALGGSETGAWILLVALAALITTHLAISVVAYRRTMRRAWPAVRPLADDDDW